MKRLFKISGLILSSAVIVVLAGVVYFLAVFPKVGPPEEIRIEPTPERLVRGRYLVHHVTGCIDCHSTRDWNYFAGPIVAGTEGKGGERFGEELGLPGTLYARNITPKGIGNWSDGELLRAITTGVTRDGQVLFPLMPYPAYNRLSREDAYSIVAYIRTLKPIENGVPERHLRFPVNLLVRQTPRPYVPAEAPKPSDTVAYGEYLAAIAACGECHTRMEKGAPVEGMEFAGGREFPLPGGVVVRSANITPDSETGIGDMTQERFIGLFKSFASPEQTPVPPGGENTIMPWKLFADMTEEDLGAIYAYLHTVKPVKNQVEKHPKSNR